MEQERCATGVHNALFAWKYTSFAWNVEMKVPIR